MLTKAKTRMRVAREDVGLSQVQLAVRSKLSLSTVRNAEQGLATTRSLAAIAKVLGVDVHQLRAVEGTRVDEFTGRKPAAAEASR